MNKNSGTTTSSRSRGSIKLSSHIQIPDDDFFFEGPLVIDCNFQSGSYQSSENPPLPTKAANNSGSRKQEFGMAPRRKSAAKSRTPSRSSNACSEKGESSTRRKRRRISRERLEDNSTPETLDSLLTDPDCNSLRESLSGRSGRSSSRPNEQPVARASTPVRSRRRVSLAEDATGVQPAVSTGKKRSRTSREQSLENIQMSLLSQTEQTDWLLPRRTTGSMSPGLVPKIKTRRPSGSSQEAVDDFCWICHRPGQLKSCSTCPRVYHSICSNAPEGEKSGVIPSHESWQCALCRELASITLGTSDAAKWGPVVSNATYENQLNKALAFMIDFMSIQSWAEPFRESVDSSENFGAPGAVRCPMDLRTLLQRVNDGQYKSTNAFLADFLWIIHNCFVSEEKPNSQLLVKARSLEQMCLCEIELLRACPTCYVNRITALPVLPSTTFVFPAISKCEPRIYRRPEMRKPAEHLNTDLAEGLWFVKPCTVIHPVVWVRFEEGRRWPGKMMAELPNKLLLVSFFGTYSTRKTPANYVTLQTCLSVSVNANTTSDTIACNEKAVEGGLRRLSDSGESKDMETHNRACEELRRHLSLLLQAFPRFRFPAAPASRVLPFSQQIIKQHYGSFNQWVLAGDSLPSPASSESGAGGSPAPTGDEVDFVQTSESCLPSSPSLATSAPSATPPAPSPPLPPPPPPPSLQTRLALAPPQLPSSSSTAFPLVGTSRSLTSEDFSEPLLARLSTNLLSSFRSSHEVREESLHEPHFSAPQVELEDKMQDPEHIGDVLVENSMYGNVDVPNAETTSTKDSSSTLPLRQSDNVPPGDLKADLIARFQEARDLFSGRFQSLVEDVFRNLEDSVNETWCVSTAATTIGVSSVSAAVSESEAPILDSNRTTTQDQETQTAPNVVVSMRSLDENKMKMALLRTEVVRQSQELERLRLLLDYTRHEMASSQRDRLTELRAVWEAELLSAVEGVVKICEKEASGLIDVVKRKQWCTYCGNEAFFYCCWNTVYCNTTCQQLHWPEHMNSCTHPKRQVMEQQEQQQQQQQHQHRQLH